MWNCAGCESSVPTIRHFSREKEERNYYGPSVVIIWGGGSIRKMVLTTKLVQNPERLLEAIAGLLRDTESSLEKVRCSRQELISDPSIRSRLRHLQHTGYKQPPQGCVAYMTTRTNERPGCRMSFPPCHQSAFAPASRPSTPRTQFIREGGKKVHGGRDNRWAGGAAVGSYVTEFVARLDLVIGNRDGWGSRGK
ncbi:hypothetical protein EJ02DRAFT_464030 [Clathrospora elynae]|uniref:Uncharacterized protein n=1 Tax=Clathrospora elynae TaxID=706981 RepID=A0A6A5SZ99_9PLEO|nr:hypothetical protein EJ02DRAFT_464030 [Clathrospora elynae]